MKAFYLTISLLSSVAFAGVSNVDVQNEPNSYGKCLELEDVGHWGYVPSSVTVTQSGDSLKFQIPTVNLTCRPSGSRSGSVAWAMDLPDLGLGKTAEGEDLEFIGVSGMLFEGERLKVAITPPVDLATIKTYSLDWEVTDLSKTLARMAPTESLTLKFTFGLKALYQKVLPPLKTYYSFSGRYGIYVTLTKQADGQILVASEILEPVL